MQKLLRRTFIQERPEFLVALAVAIALCAGIVAIDLYLPIVMKSAALESAYQSNIDVAEQIKITRGYYTKQVVAKVLASGGLTVSEDHKADSKTIPLPATFVHDISELLREKDTSLSLVSPFPWPNRAGQRMDEFQTKAWEAFQKDSSAAFSREELLGGKRVLRVAIADKMTGDACVSCHNTRADSPKKDWKIGNVRAVMEVTKVIEPYLVLADQRSRMITWAITLPALIVIGLVFGAAALFSRFQKDKRRMDDHVHFLAHHDAMTGALNRHRFLEVASKAIQHLEKGKRVAIHYIDLDRFKETNDKLGHCVGDELLHAVAKRLKSLLSEVELLSRLGGDEFAIVQTQVRGPAEITALAENISAALSKPFQLSTERVCISGSIGIAHSVRNTTASQLLENADIALYHAKAAGRSRFVLFSPRMRNELQDRRNLEVHVKQALAANAFELYFQPLVGQNRRLAGFEALLRLPDGSGNFIPPSAFIPVAERTGVINELGSWVIQRACEVAASWPSHLSIAVNLSPAQFGDSRSISDIVGTAIAQTGLTPGRLELEITEGLLLDPDEHVVEQLFALKNAGASIVMDDFGTGHSSLSNLWKLPFDKIKIDRSFVVGMNEDNSSAATVLRTIVALARNLSMQITVEGVETPDQAAFFRELGCDFYQGYLFGRPVPRQDAAALILSDLLIDMKGEVSSLVPPLKNHHKQFTLNGVATSSR